MNKASVFYYDQTPVDNIDLSVPCVVALSGMRSQTPKDMSENFLNKIDMMLKHIGISANVCGNIHDLSMLNDNVAKVFYTVNTKLHLEKKNLFAFGFQFFVPGFFNRYVQSLFDMMILPRIVDKNGNPFPEEMTKDNLRKIVFLSYCYGIRAMIMLDKKLTDKLRELNYTPQQVEDIQKQLVFIVESPSSIFMDIKSTCVKFLSLTDSTSFYKKLYSTGNNITYYEKYNIISTPKMFKVSTSCHQDREHHSWPMVARNSMTEQGRALIDMLDKAFYNALVLPRVDGIKSLVNVDDLDKSVSEKPMLKFLEKIPTRRAKNIIFVSYSFVTNHIKQR